MQDQFAHTESNKKMEIVMEFIVVIMRDRA
jgi:hypothetical protein